MAYARGALRTLALVIVAVALTSATPAFAQPSTPQPAVRDSSILSEAQGLALAHTTGKPVVVDSLTTETELTSALPDGSMQVEISNTPVRVKRGNGWVPIDSTLSVTAQGYFAPNATSTPVQFGPGGTTTLARIQTSSGAWVEETSPFGVLPAPAINGAVATYKEVLPGVDLEVTATSIGMSEVIVVKDAKAAANPALAAVKFGLSGAVVAATPGGGLIATAPDGSSIRSATPTWWDSSEGSTSKGPVGNASTAPVAQSNGKNFVVLDVAAATKSRAVTYPVYIDPDWTGTVGYFWYTDKAYPTTSYLNGAYAGGEQRSGYVSAAYSPQDNKTHVARAYWRMDTSGVNGKHVTGAKFNLTETWAFNCTPSIVNLYTVSNASPGATYDNSGGYSYSAVVASQNVAHRAGSSTCPTAAVGFDAVTPVTTAAASQVGYIDFAIVAGSETSNSGWKKWAFGASLIVTYNTIPSVPALSVASPSRTCGTGWTPSKLNGTAGVVLQSVLADPDAGASVRSDLYLAPASNLATTTLYTSASAAVGTRSISVPASALSPGDYAYRARAYDGVDYSAYSPWCYSTVDNTHPALPTDVNWTAPTGLNVGVPVTFQFTSASADQVYAFAYWWAAGPSTYPSPAVPVFSGPNGAVPACGSSSGVVTFVCAGSSGVSPVIASAPSDEVSVLWVASIDLAGNVSTDGVSWATPHDVVETANSLDYSNGHGWITNDYPTALPSSIPDRNLSGPALSTTGSVSTTSVVRASQPAVAVMNFNSSSTTGALTAASVTDTTQSFTASVWVSTGSKLPPTTWNALSIAGSGVEPAFAIQLVNGRWQACVTAQPTGVKACAVGDLASTNWKFLTAVWNAQSNQISIYSDLGTPVAAKTVVVPTGSTAATAALRVGGPVAVGTAAVLLANPEIFPGVLSHAQLLNLRNFDTTADGS